MPRKNRPLPYIRYTYNTPCSHKNAYANKANAQQLAERAMLEQPNIELSAYRCESCHKWHLTSKKPTTK